MQEFSVYYFTNQVAKEVKTSNSSILRWAEVLESQGYKFERDEKGQYKYKHEDIEAIKRFKELKDMNRASQETAAKMVVVEFSQRINESEIIRRDPHENPSSNELVPDSYYAEQLELLKQQIISPIQNEMMKVKQYYDEQIREMRSKLEALPEPVSQFKIQEIAAEEQQVIVFIEMDVKAKLRKMAIGEWSNKPESERMIRVGFFKKIENSSAREDFIRNYIAENFKSEVEKEMIVRRNARFHN